MNNTAKIWKKEIPQVVIFYGPPGSGKGTQAKMLEEKFGYKFLEFGQNFRDFAKKHLDNSDPDQNRAARVNKDLIEGRAILTEDLYYIIRSKIEEYITSGVPFILDKPGSLIPEAMWLADLIASKNISSIMIHLKLDTKESIKRISNRWYIPSNPTPYQSRKEATKASQVSIGGEKPYQRKEDENKQTTLKRIKNLYDQHEKITKIYKDAKIKVVEIEGKGSVQEVLKRIIEVLN